MFDVNGRETLAKIHPDILYMYIYIYRYRWHQQANCLANMLNYEFVRLDNTCIATTLSTRDEDIGLAAAYAATV